MFRRRVCKGGLGVGDECLMGCLKSLFGKTVP